MPWTAISIALGAIVVLLLLGVLVAKAFRD
jgi:hypothetical protein